MRSKKQLGPSGALEHEASDNVGDVRAFHVQLEGSRQVGAGLNSSRSCETAPHPPLLFVYTVIMAFESNAFKRHGCHFKSMGKRSAKAAMDAFLLELFHIHKVLIILQVEL